MDKALLKKEAIQSVALMIAVVTVSYAMQKYQAIEILAGNLMGKDAADSASSVREGELLPAKDGLPVRQGKVSSVTGAAITAASLSELQVDESILNKLSDNYLIIMKPEADNLTIQLEDLYIDGSIRLDLAGLRNSEINSDMILRVRGSDFYRGAPKFTEIVSHEIDEDGNSMKKVITKDYGMDLSHGITVTTQLDEKTGLYNAQILIELDSVYAYFIYEDENYYFIDLKKPSDVYDRILVIDAGHGGKDAGALSRDKKYYEKNINLDIVLQLKKLLDKDNIKVYYTRTGDDTVFLRPRAALANAVDCDYFISIHCNSYVAAAPNGTEVLYYNNMLKGVAVADLARLFSEEMGKTVKLRNRGAVEKHKNEIFIMDKSQIPTILIEVGYLSNNRDLEYLINPENRKIAAQGIYNSIMRAYDELPATRNE